MPHETVTELSQLIDRVKSYNVEADLDLVRRAYDFSAKAHEGQMRRSGEPYFRHPLAVAGLLTHLKTDVTAIVAGLLHDTLEDTLATPLELEQRFGKDVVHLVDGVTKIGKITFRNYEEKQAENFRKMVLSMADDIRVVLIKLADRLHNMRTLEYLSEGKRQQIAQETLEIYAPLANRLGIGWIKNELEDLCLKHLKPDVYESLRVRVAKRDEDRQQYIIEVIDVVKKAMAEVGVVHRERPVHLGPEPLRHLDRLFHFGERVVEPAFAEIQLSQPTPCLKIVRLGAEQLFNLRNFFVGAQRLIARIHRRASLLCSACLCLFIHNKVS